MRIEPFKVVTSRRAGQARPVVSTIAGLAFAVALGWGGHVVAQDASTPIDGLNADVRASLYNAGTSLVAKLDLTQLGHDRLLQTFHGLFDPTEYQYFLSNTTGSDAQLEQFLTPTKAADALVAIEYKTLTVVVLQGMSPFAALLLGTNVDETTFAGAEIGIRGALTLLGLPVDVIQKGDYALVGNAKTPLPQLPHVQSIEDTVLLGLQQPQGAPAVSFVSPVDDALRAQLASGGANAPEFTAAIGQADYIGGYLVTGFNPQIHLYVRYSSEATAGNVKALYDKAWQQQIAQADKEDADNKTAMLQEVSYISTGEMTRRIQAAMPVKVFGGIVMLDLDTIALRQITAAVIERYYRKVPKDSTGGTTQ